MPAGFCSSVQNQNLCDGSSSQIGLIVSRVEDERFNKAVFFFSDRQPLETDRFEFHSKQSGENNQSYIYMLFDLKHAPISQVKEYLSFTPSEGDLHEFTNFKV